MATIEEFVVQLGWETSAADQKKLKDFESNLDGLISGIVKLGAAMVTAGAALIGLTAVTNKATAVQSNLAAALGISAEALETYGFLLGAIGFSADQATDSLRFMNDKIGELAQGSKAPETLTRAIDNLGLSYKKLKDLSPEKQFETILQATQDAEDGQLAMSSATELLGRQSVKLVGYFRTQEKSVAELLETQRQMNLQTDEGRVGAIRMAAAMDNFGAVTESTWKLFSGLVGESISPIIEGFNDWVAANRELIQLKISDWADRISKAIEWMTPKIIWLIGKLEDLWDWSDKVIKRLGGMENAVRLLGIILGSAMLLKGLLMIRRIGNAAALAQLKMFAWIAIIALVALAIEDVWLFLTDPEADTMIGRILEKFEEWLGIDLIEPIREALPGIKAFFEAVWDVVKWASGLIIGTWVNILQFFIDVFSKDLGTAWDLLLIRMTDVWGDTWTDMATIFDTILVQPLVNAFEYISAQIPGIITSARDVLKDLPFVGSLFDSGSGAASATTTNSPTTNNSSNVAVTVNAQTNASPQDIGRAVKVSVEEMFAGAVRSNDTGVER